MTVRICILEGRRGFAKSQVYPMSYREGKPGQSRHDKMPDFDIMDVIVIKGFWPKGHEENPLASALQKGSIQWRFYRL